MKIAQLTNSKLLIIFILFFKVLFLPFIVFAQLEFKHLSINEGLSQNGVLCMLQDKEGFIWLGTEDGLNRYDGYEFKKYKYQVDNPQSISSSFINTIVESENGDLWIATDDGLNFYNKNKDAFSRIETISEESKLLNRDFINSLLLDGQNLWVGTIEGLKKYDFKQKQFVQISKENRKKLNLENRPHAIFKDNEGKLWVGNTFGLRCYDSKTGNSIIIPKAISDLDKAYVRVVKQDLLGRIWFGTEYNGIFIYDSKNQLCADCNPRDNQPTFYKGVTIREIFFKSKDEVWIGTLEGLGIISGAKSEHHTYNPGKERGLSHNSIRSILQDNSGNIWLGTYAGGINIYFPNQLKFNLFAEKSTNRNGLNHPVVSSIIEGNNNSLWIGTEGGGLNFYEASTGKYSYYLNNSEGKGLQNNIVKSLVKLDGKHLWVGTYNGLSLFNTQSKTFTLYPHVIDPLLAGSKQIYALLQTQEGLWIGTNGGGLRFLDNKNKLRIFLYNAKNTSGISSNNITAISKDAKGNLWVATQKGLNYFDVKTFKNKTFFHNTKDKLSLSNNQIFSVFVDSKNRVWVGTNGGGLNLFSNNNFYRITENEGIGNNVIHAINEDNGGNIWISTNKGLSRIISTSNKNFDYKNLQVSKYSVEDGLLSNQFSTNAVLRTQEGALYFGGIKGISSFYPQNIKSNLLKPNVVFTDIRVKDSSLQESSTASTENGDIILKYNHGSITFKFAALNFLTPEKNLYAYKLDGLKNDEDWHYVNANQRIATYTNLSAGTYVFRLKAANNDGIWNNDEKVITIKVLPPFWKTWWAYCIYVFIIIVLLYLFYYYSLKTAKLKNELYFEHLSHVKDQELAEQKINFFTNISHEIKTPLTLIIAPLDNMIKATRESSKIKPQLLMMQRNGERLSRLIHQLLDFRKFESGNMLLKNTENDLVQFLREIYVVFESYASQKNIVLKFQSEYTELPLWFDEDKLEKIMYNLLSNAIKFSKEKGEILIRLRSDIQKESFLNIDVEDNGIGISEKEITTIFKQFQRNEDNNTNSEGTGIGLAFSKGLAELLGGDLTVKSSKQEVKASGCTCFTLKIPLLKTHVGIGAGEEEMEDNQGEEMGVLNISEKDNHKVVSLSEEVSVLIVEDNEDLLEFMKGAFTEKYNIKTAKNGVEALLKLKEFLPDVIISDVMMPEMNGIELCKKVKSDIRISHIPFILLTARTPIMYKIEGFEIGADDYITKPFRIDVLTARINNLVLSRKNILTKYKTELTIQPQNISVSSPDEVFLSKIMDFVEKNLSEPVLNVEQMAKEVGMGRSALYRKIKSLTGMTAIEFIRNVRMKRAAQLLKQKKMNVNEVVYSIGFTDVDYFRRCFKEEFGMTPTEYMNTEYIKNQ